MAARHEEKDWSLWLRDNRQYWMLLALGTLGLTLGRACLMWWQAPPAWQAEADDVWRAFWIGARFDLKNLAILLGAPLLLFGLAARALPARAARVWERLWRGWTWLAMLLVNLLMVSNHYYFRFYQGPINDQVFGLAEDDTGAVLNTMWHDFPVLRLLAGVVALTAAQIAIARWWSRRAPLGLSGRQIALVALCSLLATAGLARGSLGKFPLRTMHMAVSSDTFTNNLVPSGLLAVVQAWRERNISDLGRHADVGLKGYGFASIDEAIGALATSTGAGPGEAAATDWMWQDLPRQPVLAAARPHVAMAVMEGWGRHLMDFDDPAANDLLGRLRPWLADGRLDYFDRALSSQNGTHSSLEALLLDTPITPLIQGRYDHLTYETSVALPYKQAGYRTVFLTAGPESWRKLDTALKQQGFDEVLGEQAILERFPDATTHTWGVDDEWMFRYALELLAEADARKQPVLLVMLSVTSHPPYRVPPHYTASQLDVARLGAALATDPATGMSILQTYQYANDALGGFLDGLAAGGLLDRTLFAATGDHNTRTLFNYPDSRQLHYKYGVPIVMRIPQPYRLGGMAHTREWTSHQDIFPTLWAHSLSGARVPRVGRDLYADAMAPAAVSFIGESAAQGAGILVSDAGAVSGLRGPVFYHWNAEGQLVPTKTPSSDLTQLWRRERARMALRDWRIRSLALETGRDGPRRPR